ncbi:RNA 3'-terminal phosphate cyclase-domain-containing protein [Kalaharituber pfeilii]|nr:RNA 3'-terminal phosphate cyclase-domain-containing protein [Kalaharituber pfeilii]
MPRTPKPPPPPPPIHLHGYYLEGGGQILRNALSLSVLLSLPIHITSIRTTRRDGGGLKAQHVACVKALTKLAGEGTKVNKGLGAWKSAKEVEFYPPPPPGLHSVGEDEVGEDEVGKGGLWKKVQVQTKEVDGVSSVTERREISIEIGGVGSVMLVLQAVLPVLMFNAAKYPPYNNITINNAENATPPLSLIIIGGTNVSFSPSYEYVKLILLPTLVDIVGLPRGLDAHLERRAWAGSMQVGTVRVDVIPLKKGEGVKGFEIKRNGERVRKVSITFVVPTEEEVPVWQDIGKGIVGGIEWGKFGIENGNDIVKDVSELKIGDQVKDLQEGERDTATICPPREVEVEITSLSGATLPKTRRAAGLGGANARNYYVLVHTTSWPSGYRMGYDKLYTASSRELLPGNVDPVHGTLSDRSKGRKGKGGKTKKDKAHGKDKVFSYKDGEEANENTADGTSGTHIDPNNKPLLNSARLAQNLFREPVGRLNAAWKRGDVIDEYLQDQLVLWQAVATGRSWVEGKVKEDVLHGEEGEEGEEVYVDEEGKKWGVGSLHTKTARWVAQEIAGAEWDGEGLEGCWGVGLKAGEAWKGKNSGEGAAAEKDEGK